MAGDAFWVRSLACLPVRDAIQLSASSRALRDAVRTRLSLVRKWDFPATASDTAVIALAERCAGLTTVDLSECENVTDAAVLRLAERCAGLTTIELCGCGNITDAACSRLRARFPALIVYEP